MSTCYCTPDYVLNKYTYVCDIQIDIYDMEQEVLFDSLSIPVHWGVSVNSTEQELLMDSVAVAVVVDNIIHNTTQDVHFSNVDLVIIRGVGIDNVVFNLLADELYFEIEGKISDVLFKKAIHSIDIKEIFNLHIVTEEEFGVMAANGDFDNNIVIKCTIYTGDDIWAE